MWKQLQLLVSPRVNTFLKKNSVLSYSFVFILQCLLCSLPKCKRFLFWLLVQSVYLVVVQSLSRVRLFATPWTAARRASLCFITSQSLLTLLSIELVMPFNHLVLCCLLFLLLSSFLSIRVFSKELVLHIRWPKYCSFSFSITPCNEYSGLISFRTDWFDLLAVQGTLKSFLQHHSTKASILCHSAFFMVQLSHPYMTTRKTIALTIQTFVGKVMSLLFNPMSRFVLAFLPGSNCLNFLAAFTVCSDFGAQENKVCHCFHCLPTDLPWSDGTGCHDLRFLNVEF